MSWVKVCLQIILTYRTRMPNLFVRKLRQMNQLHWHVVDSQSFPLQVPGFTELAQEGAYDSGSVFTPQDVADIVSYAGAVCLGVIVDDTCLT